ncbi:unnamed protein product, partial [Rotaria magnacalcarata]
MLKDVRSMEQINQSATSCRDNLKDQQEIQLYFIEQLQK